MKDNWEEANIMALDRVKQAVKKLDTEALRFKGAVQAKVEKLNLDQVKEAEEYDKADDQLGVAFSQVFYEDQVQLEFAKIPRWEEKAAPQYLYFAEMEEAAIVLDNKLKRAEGTRDTARIKALQQVVIAAQQAKNIPKPVIDTTVIDKTVITSSNQQLSKYLDEVIATTTKEMQNIAAEMALKEFNKMQKEITDFEASLVGMTVAEKIMAYKKRAHIDDAARRFREADNQSRSGNYKNELMAAVIEDQKSNPIQENKTQSRENFLLNLGTQNMLHGNECKSARKNLESFYKNHKKTFLERNYHSGGQYQAASVETTAQLDRTNFERGLEAYQKQVAQQDHFVQQHLSLGDVERLKTEDQIPWQRAILAEDLLTKEFNPALRFDLKAKCILKRLENTHQAQKAVYMQLQAAQQRFTQANQAYIAAREVRNKNKKLQQAFLLAEAQAEEAYQALGMSCNECFAVIADSVTSENNFRTYSPEWREVDVEYKQALQTDLQRHEQLWKVGFAKQLKIPSLVSGPTDYGFLGDHIEKELKEVNFRAEFEDAAQIAIDDIRFAKLQQRHNTLFLKLTLLSECDLFHAQASAGFQKTFTELVEVRKKVAILNHEISNLQEQLANAKKDKNLAKVNELTKQLKEKTDTLVGTEDFVGLKQELMEKIVHYQAKAYAVKKLLANYPLDQFKGVKGQAEVYLNTAKLSERMGQEYENQTRVEYRTEYLLEQMKGFNQDTLFTQTQIDALKDFKNKGLFSHSPTYFDDLLNKQKSLQQFLSEKLDKLHEAEKLFATEKANYKKSWFKYKSQNYKDAEANVTRAQADLDLANYFAFHVVRHTYIVILFEHNKQGIVGEHPRLPRPFVAMSAAEKQRQLKEYQEDFLKAKPARDESKTVEGAEPEEIELKTFSFRPKESKRSTQPPKAPVQPSLPRESQTVDETTPLLGHKTPRKSEEVAGRAKSKLPSKKEADWNVTDAEIGLGTDFKFTSMHDVGKLPEIHSVETREPTVSLVRRLTTFVVSIFSKKSVAQESPKPAHNSESTIIYELNHTKEKSKESHPSIDRTSKASKVAGTRHSDSEIHYRKEYNNVSWWSHVMPSKKPKIFFGETPHEDEGEGEGEGETGPLLQDESRERKSKIHK